MKQLRISAVPGGGGRWTARVEAVASHRNGVAGNRFKVVIFHEKGNGRMLGIQFGNARHGSMNTAVLNLDEAAKGNIAFGSNSWRGDDYAWPISQMKEEETK